MSAPHLSSSAVHSVAPSVGSPSRGIGGGVGGAGSSSSGVGSDPSVASIQTSTAVPILKVMRLQAPELSQPSYGASLGTPSLPSPALALPDSFGVIHIGETFTAYLGALNPSSSVSIEGLTVLAQLQTPSRRFTLPSQMDERNASGGVTVSPYDGVDAIVSRSLEEVGQHILRVEVGYANGTKTLRKFYRFHVASPLNIQELTLRSGDNSCFVSIAIENVTSSTYLTISGAEFVPPDGLEAITVKTQSPSTTTTTTTTQQQKQQQQLGQAQKSKQQSSSRDSATSPHRSAVELFDRCGRIAPGGSMRYLFQVKTLSGSDEAAARGIAAGDVLGKAIFTWHKAMGEAGRIASTDVLCPASDAITMPPSGPNSNKFVIHRSGLSVDVAASAADRSAGYTSTTSGGDMNTLSNRSNGPTSPTLDELFPVTVDPIDPPKSLILYQPQSVTLCITNHSLDEALNLQLQMRLSEQMGVVVCGTSFQNLGIIKGDGGSHIATIRIVALEAGLFALQGCYLMDMNSGREFPIPPLFHVFVQPPPPSLSSSTMHPNTAESSGMSSNAQKLVAQSSTQDSSSIEQSFSKKVQEIVI